MKLHIPNIWDRFILENNWSFKLFLESRNNNFLKTFKNVFWIESKDRKIYFFDMEDLKKNNIDIPKMKECSYWSYQTIIETSIEEKEKIINKLKDFEIWINYIPVTLPKDSILTIDRIYLRKGQKDFATISFWGYHESFWKKKFRFWAKLNEVNNIWEITLL